MTRPSHDTPADSHANAPASGPALTADDVAAFLRAQPDFFERHPQVLEELSLPHVAGQAVSLVERQVSILRDRNIDMRARLSSMVTNARANDSLFEHTRGLVLDALDATDLHGLLDAARRHLVDDFGAEHVAFVMFVPNDAAAAQVPNVRFDTLESAQGAIANLLRNQQTVLGMLRPAEATYLFPQQSPPPASAAVVPLQRTDLYGVLAIGSNDAQRFTGEMGTLFVRYVGEVIARLIARLPGA